MVSNDSSNPPNPTEENTYREGVQRASDLSFASVDKRFTAFDVTLKEFVSRAEEKAQVANDSLQALLEANLGSMIKVADKGIENTREVIRHMESRIGHAREIAQTAISNVDSRADLLAARLASLTEMVQLRDEVNTMAIEKAEQTLERRLDALSEFNSHSNNNEQNYVTRSILDARLDRVAAQTEKLQSYLTALHSKFIVAAVTIVVLVVGSQLLLVNWHH